MINGDCSIRTFLSFCVETSVCDIQDPLLRVDVCRHRAEVWGAEGDRSSICFYVMSLVINFTRREVFAFFYVSWWLINSQRLRTQYVKVILCPVLSDSRRRIAIWKVSSLRLFALLVSATCRWRYVEHWLNGSDRGKTEVLGRKIRVKATLSTI